MEIANHDLVKVLSRANECMRRLIEAGLTYEDLQTPIDDPEKRKRIVDFWKSQTPEKKLPKLDVINDLILDSFKSIDSKRYTFGKNAVVAFVGTEIHKYNNLKAQSCEKMLEILMSYIDEKLPKKYLNMPITKFSTYEDWYNYRRRESHREIKNIRDVIKSCVSQLLHNENTILGFPKTNWFEEDQFSKLINIFKYFGYNIKISEHEPVSNVGGIIIQRSNYELKEKFAYYQVTSCYYRDPFWDE